MLKNVSNCGSSIFFSHTLGQQVCYDIAAHVSIFELRARQGLNFLHLDPWVELFGPGGYAMVSPGIPTWLPSANHRKTL